MRHRGIACTQRSWRAAARAAAAALRPAAVLVAVLILATASGAAAAPAIAGRVVDAGTEAPLAGAYVSAGAATTVTDEDGSFRLGPAPQPVDSVHVSYLGYRPVTVAAGVDLRVALTPVSLAVDEVVVRAGLTEERLQRTAASVSVLAGPRLRATGGTHLQDVIADVPNLNWAGGTSRPRYFQIRGIGERSRYAGEGPPSFTVGTVVDDVDLSGLGTGGLLFDVDQVEVYRGPQSTIFGANAMAGLIHVRSADPGPTPDVAVAGGLGSDGRLEAEAVVNAPLAPDLGLRVGASQGRSDGFRDNVYLGRHDTNRRRESVARAKLRWSPGAARVTATTFLVDADNGYDAWAPDNNEALRSYADKPGVDEQRTGAASLRAEVPVAGLRLVSISAWSHTDGVYSYDSDWGNDAFWRAEPYGFDPDVEGWRYDFFDRMERQRTTWTQQLRLRRRGLPRLGGDAVVGVFGRSLAEDTDASGYLFGGDAGDLSSAFDVDEVALYGRYERQLSARLRATATVRTDHDATAYDGVTDAGLANSTRVRFDDAQWLAGGRLGLTWALRPAWTGVASLSRGYRAGGVNQHPRLADANRPYDAEYVINAEAGLRWLGEAGRGALTLFRTTRADQQVELSTQQDPGDPNSFVYFTNNAGRGSNAGLEAEGQWHAAGAWRLSGAAGLLRSHVDAYTFRTGQGDTLTLGDRAAAHAPTWNLRLGLAQAPARGPQASLTVTGMDAFYYSDSHDQRSDAYGLLHGSVGWRGDGWSVSLWGRNLLDERYTVRGFYFGLEPPDYPDRLYVQYGDPRQVGFTLRWQLAAMHEE